MTRVQNPSQKQASEIYNKFLCGRAHLRWEFFFASRPRRKGPSKSSTMSAEEGTESSFSARIVEYFRGFWLWNTSDDMPDSTMDNLAHAQSVPGHESVNQSTVDLDIQSTSEQLRFKEFNSVLFDILEQALLFVKDKYELQQSWDINMGDQYVSVPAGTVESASYLIKEKLESIMKSLTSDEHSIRARETTELSTSSPKSGVSFKGSAAQTQNVSLLKSQAIKLCGTTSNSDFSVQSPRIATDNASLAQNAIVHSQRKLDVLNSQHLLYDEIKALKAENSQLKKELDDEKRERHALKKIYDHLRKKLLNTENTLENARDETEMYKEAHEDLQTRLGNKMDSDNIILNRLADLHRIHDEILHYFKQIERKLPSGRGYFASLSARGSILVNRIRAPFSRQARSANSPGSETNNASSISHTRGEPTSDTVRSDLPSAQVAPLSSESSSFVSDFDGQLSHSEKPTTRAALAINLNRARDTFMTKIGLKPRVAEDTVDESTGRQGAHVAQLRQRMDAMKANNKRISSSELRNVLIQARYAFIRAYKASIEDLAAVSAVVVHKEEELKRLGKQLDLSYVCTENLSKKLTEITQLRNMERRGLA